MKRDTAATLEVWAILIAVSIPTILELLRRLW